jgi:hypothetical protein
MGENSFGAKDDEQIASSTGIDAAVNVRLGATRRNHVALVSADRVIFAKGICAS